MSLNGHIENKDNLITLKEAKLRQCDNVIKSVLEFLTFILSLLHCVHTQVGCAVYEAQPFLLTEKI